VLCSFLLSKCHNGFGTDLQPHQRQQACLRTFLPYRIFSGTWFPLEHMLLRASPTDVGDVNAASFASLYPQLHTAKVKGSVKGTRHKGKCKRDKYHDVVVRNKNKKVKTRWTVDRLELQK
jgi:hypothetical protein